MTARHFQSRDPFNPINSKLGRPLLFGLTECVTQVVNAANRAAVDGFDCVAIDNWNRLVVGARFEPRVAQRALLTHAVYFDAAAKGELSKDKKDIHHRRGDQS